MFNDTMCTNYFLLVVEGGYSQAPPATLLQLSRMPSIEPLSKSWDKDRLGDLLISEGQRLLREVRISIPYLCHWGGPFLCGRTVGRGLSQAPHEDRLSSVGKSQRH